LTAAAVADRARRVAELAAAGGRTVAVAESLTSGRLASALGEAPDAAGWFRGAVVAYAPGVKFEVLGVTPGTVMSASCALEMAGGALELLAADVAVAVTGVGGPGPEEGVPAGTVYVALATAGGLLECAELHVPGPPEEVVERATEECLESLVRALARG
jgi:nicotinamide-nucleotide amidase